MKILFILSYAVICGLVGGVAQRSYENSQAIKKLTAKEIHYCADYLHSIDGLYCIKTTTDPDQAAPVPPLGQLHDR